jgi:exonuclease SbcC
MITHLKLQNFQSHKNTEVTFTKGLNGIIGSSNVGKSALIRAMRWILFNERYSNFTTWGQKATRGEITFDSGIKLIRERSKTVNKYIIVENGKERELNNFGDYPEELHLIVKTNFLQLDDKTEFNLSAMAQHDSIFLLTQTGSVKAKAINSLIGAHIIDNVLREILLDGRKAKNTLDEATSQIAEKSKEFDELAIVDTLKVTYAQLSALNKQYKEVLARREMLQQLLYKCNIQKEKNIQCINKLKSLANYDPEVLSKFDTYKNRYIELMDLKNLIYKNEQDLKSLVIGKPVRDEDIQKFEALKNRSIELNALKQRIESVEGNIKNASSKLDHAKLSYEGVVKIYVEGVKALNICPICNNKLTEAHLKKIAKSFVLEGNNE